MQTENLPVIAIALALLVSAVAQSADAQQSGLPSRPPNATCLAPDPPPPAASVSVTVEGILGSAILSSTTSAVQSPVDPDRW